ncbi:S-adenosylmethionine:tRNA ribosyltransferase-isomerase [Saccharicrinis aurantiacus]|uniref:S-adenosylmethionine:tRNA ribosyltransferase-isomerase n=1 Tax=Saccharicrinis aurantiacus TaxID=1849719 RepID=UPI000837AAC0|nr:S-adenosylmethionine:tRNA ribosyltransferase-isomerase [Saccharicrinis aurantiacus]
MSRPDISIAEYTYNLPDERIAKYPLDNRSDSKLLVFNGGNIQELKFSDIVNELPNNSLLTFNNTKVIQARLPFQKVTGANIEVFCLEPIEPVDINLIFQTTDTCTWKCIVGNSKKWKTGPLEKKIEINGEDVTLQINRISAGFDSQIIQFNWDKNVLFSDLIEAIGKIPIPPYLNRESEEIDSTRYQTVYSNHKGSVAAPTAGLHFTPEILENLSDKEIDLSYVTLHVGAGTFKPVKTDNVADHEMHIEHFFVELDTINNLLNHEGNITSTGTTTVRTLESLYWLGVKLLEGSNEFYIKQWDAYELPQHYSFSDALNKLKEHLETNERVRIESHTGIMIAPGYQFKIVDRLITNFHQPTSTLLLLISAFTGGDNWKKIYDYALSNDFRFLSYGDSSLLHRTK